jgi:putative hydrolase of the HAD superfamily
MSATERFIYFDLGNVVLHFDHDRAARQMAEVAGVSVRQVRDLVFTGDLQTQYETGRISSRQFYDEFRERTGSRASLEDLFRAASDMFEINASMLPLIAQLRAAGYRLGVLSNTCEAHWQFITDGRYAILPAMFEQCVLSFRVGHMKPSAGIYRAAVDMAQVQPQQIFYTDDLPANVDGAQRVGLDAELFTTAAALAESLRERGFEFNY